VDTSYRRTRSLPSLPGVNVTVAVVSPGVTVRPVGAAGVVAGVTARPPLAEPLPAAFKARIFIVYAVPFVKPVTVPLPPDAVSVFQLAPPSVDMARGFVLDDQHRHAPAYYRPVAYRPHIENRIRAGNIMLP
jgi:hypothetical protein